MGMQSSLPFNLDLQYVLIKTKQKKEWNYVYNQKLADIKYADAKSLICKNIGV